MHHVRCQALRCGCNECTTAILGNMTSDGFTCGDRISALIENEDYPEELACQEVSENYPDICGPYCHPYKCDDWPSYCGCQDCTEQLWSFSVDGSNSSTCGTQIRNLQQTYGVSEEDACARISEQWPLQCGPSCHPAKCDNRAPPLCGCDDCTQAIWNIDAGGFTCGERILSVMTTGVTEQEACRPVSVEFPSVCGPRCNPDKCDGQPLFCGCHNCTKALNNRAGDFTCGERIDFLQKYEGGFQTEEEACLKVSTEYPSECGECNIYSCDGKGSISQPLPSFGLSIVLLGISLLVL